MSIKKFPVHVILEVDSRFCRDVTKSAGVIKDVDLEALIDLLDRLGLKIYDHVAIKKYFPTKEDLEK